METKSKKKVHRNIVQAVEALSKIADLQLDSSVGVVEAHLFALQEFPVPYETAHWLHKEDAQETVHSVKEMYKELIGYLLRFFETEFQKGEVEGMEEQLKSIMVLAGEAAKKVDKMTGLYRGRKLKSVTALPEFRRLQSFYRDRIAKKKDALRLEKFVPTLISRRGAKISLKRRDGAQKTFIDLETVKKDGDYELFSLKKEGGKRFYNPKLIRNLKVVSDLEGQFGRQASDPLVGLGLWQDRARQVIAKGIVVAAARHFDHFYQVYQKVKDQEFASLVNKMAMALMLASNPRNLMRNSPVKSCTQYFDDFQHFLWDLLRSRSYRQMARGSSGHKRDTVLGVMDELISACCQAYCLNTQGHRVLEGLLLGYLEKERAYVDTSKPEEGEELPLSRYLKRDYQAMLSLFRKHPNGPLNKTLELLDKRALEVFEPLRQGNYPNRLFVLFGEEGQRVVLMRLPSPTRQEYVHEAEVSELFKGMLRGYSLDKVRRKHLMINLQDRTHWKEHPRAAVLEELQKREEVAKVLTVVTFPVDTDFYSQLAPYHDLDEAKAFIQQFEEHLHSEHAGFYFPPSARRALSHRFLTQMLGAVHRVFFGGRKTLSRHERLDFIEMAYMLMQLKLVEHERPTSLSLTCKDGVDVGMAATVQLVIFLKILTASPFSEDEKIYLDLLLHGPALSLRERAIQASRFDRMVSVLERLEQLTPETYSTPRAFTQKVAKELIPLYRTSLLREAHLELPRFL